MKGFILTHKGLEQVCADELSALGVKAKALSNRVEVDCSDKELAEICYRSRTSMRVIKELSRPAVSVLTEPDFIAVAESSIKKTFTVTCERTGDHPFTSFDLEQYCVSFLAKKGFKLDRKNPETTIFVFIDNNEALVGVDIAGRDLSKRDYRIFLGTGALKGTFAAGALLFAGYNSKLSLLDPFCRHGIIPIEAALMATNSSPHKFSKEKLAFFADTEVKDKEIDSKNIIIAMDDNFKHVSSAKKNAKIAGVMKTVEFSRTDLKWLDAKFGRNFLDLIVTFPPQSGKSLAESSADKIYHQIFYQAEFILKKSGQICLIMRSGLDTVRAKAKEFKFSVEKELVVNQGNEKFVLMLFKK